MMDCINIVDDGLY